MKNHPLPLSSGNTPSAISPRRRPPAWLLACCIAPLPTATAAEPSAAPALPPPGYTLFFEENFDGGAVDESRWVYRMDRRGGEANFSGINGLNRKENVSVADGVLRVRLDQEMINGKKENTGGGLISRHRFGFGYYECRYRPLMAGHGGVHCAFWQRGTTPDVLKEQPLDGTTPPRNVIFEIDSSELDNPEWIGTNNLYDVIAPKSLPEGTWPLRLHIPITPPEDGWFVDAYEYRPDGITFYDNGREVASIRYDRVTGQQNVWLTALNGFGTIRDTTIYPGVADFDYFRYYAKDYPGANLLANPGFEYNLDAVDLQTPIAWCEQGDADASRVVKSSPGARDAASLRHSAATPGAPYTVTTSQTLQHITDGAYAASALVRSSGGQAQARLTVRSGDQETSVPIPAADQWQRIILPVAQVIGHEATISVTSQATADQWLEVDDVQFLKPATPEALVLESQPFQPVLDPAWQLLGNPLLFRDGAFAFFGREVGQGPAITASLRITPDAVRDQIVLERMPAKGRSGWSLRLTANGEAAFRIGSVADHSELLAPIAYRPGETLNIACAFTNGTAQIYLNGKEIARRENIPQDTLDKTAAGTVGGKHRTSSKLPYQGELSNIRIYNRTLAPEEIARLAE